MNAHSEQGLCQGSPAPLREPLRTLLSHRGLDRRHDVGTRCSRGDWIDVKVQMGDLDAELQQDRAFAPCLAKEEAFGFAVYTREMRELLRLEPGHVLDMTLPDHHGVTGNAAVGMKSHSAVIILIDQCAEPGEVAFRRTERAMH